MEFNEETKISTENSEGEENYAYKNVIPDKQHRRTWSLAALGLAILSLLLSHFSWIGLILGLISIAATVVSRKNLQYFDKITLAALIVAIFGLVFSLTGIIFADIISVFMQN